jgi:hypothetical protein
VLAVAELATAFVGDLSWRGATVFAGFFTAIWFSWVGFTLYANRSTPTMSCFVREGGGDPGDRRLRGERDRGDRFARLGVRRQLPSRSADAGLLYLRAWRHVHQARGTISVYLAAAMLSAHCGPPPSPRRTPHATALWEAAVLVDVTAPALATRHENDVPLHLERSRSVSACSSSSCSERWSAQRSPACTI